MKVNMDKETADGEMPDPRARANEDGAVRQARDEVTSLAGSADKEHALVRYDKVAITKSARSPSSRQAVIAAVHDANCKRKDADAALDVAESAATTARGIAYTYRIELGRALIEARKLFPISGPKSKGWGELLESEGLPRTTALNYMTLAGYFNRFNIKRIDLNRGWQK